MLFWQILTTQSFLEPFFVSSEKIVTSLSAQNIHGLQDDDHGLERHEDGFPKLEEDEEKSYKAPEDQDHVGVDSVGDEEVIPASITDFLGNPNSG